MIGGLAAAVGVPYVLFSDGLHGAVSGIFAGDPSDTRGSPVSDELQEQVEQITGPTSVRPPPPPLAGPQVTHFGEVLRFDVTPQWVMSRWSRVSTTLSETALEGLRVPLVTGPKPEDLAGSLTYYFDGRQRLMRIGFEGETGDARPLTAFVTGAFGFSYEPALGGGTYLRRWNGRPVGALLVEYAGVIRADAPDKRLQVTLEINRPDRYYGISPQLADHLARLEAARRWPNEANRAETGWQAPPRPPMAKKP